MIWIVKILAIALIVWGCILALKPKLIRKVIDYAKDMTRVYIISGVKILAGGLLILAAQEASLPWVVLLWGSLLVFSGILAFAVKKDSITALLNWIETRSSKQLLLVAGFILLVGISLAFAA